MTKTRWGAALGLALFATVALEADTLVLRDGRRLDGQLVAATELSIEFRLGGPRGRLERFDREAVRAIELGDSRSSDLAAERQRPRRPRPRGLREREVIVSGDVPFVDAGIDVQAGQQLYFDSVGTVWWRNNRKDGPDGDVTADYNPKRPLPRRGTAALIGKVGQESTELFFIGSDPGPIRIQNSGRLFLGVNDDYFADNHGNFRVVVFY